MKAPSLLLLSIFISSLTALGAMTLPDIALRFVSAAQAFDALKQQLGPTAAGAVSRLDERHNSIALHPTHPDANKVREFLAAFDHRQPQVRVDATITKRIEATATSPARDEVVSRPTIFSPADRPIVLSIPGDRSSTNIELRITTTPK